MKKSCLIIGTLLWGMSAFAQTTIWKRSGWECRISDKGTLEQIVFKDVSQTVTLTQKSVMIRCLFFMIRVIWVPVSTPIWVTGI